MHSLFPWSYVFLWGGIFNFLWCSMKGLQHKQADLAEDTKCPIKPQISWFCFGQITKTPKHVQQFTVHLRPQKTNKQTNKESLSLLWELWMLQSMQPVVKATSLCKYSPMMCILYKILLITYEQSLNYKLHGQNFLFSVTQYFSPHPFTQQSTAPLSPCIRLTACRLVNKAGRYKSC